MTTMPPGRVVDRYTVEAEIGSGGMATVYRVRHNSLGSTHALKLLHLQSATIRERLMQEGRIQATLQHPNIVMVTDVIDVDGSSGLVMQFVDGPTLEDWLLENRPSLATAEKLFHGILSGVARAHRAGLVHRDLKPGNVLLSQEDEGLVPKVTDFGLVKVVAQEERANSTRAGQAMGTPSYMSPEQIRDAKNVDKRTDIFALGCILYELTCAKKPFEGEDTWAVFNAITAGTYAPPQRLVRGLPDRIADAIEGCLKLDREQRIGDCAELRQILAGESLAPQHMTDESPVAAASGARAEAVAAVSPTPRPVAGTWVEERVETPPAMPANSIASITPRTGETLVVPSAAWAPKTVTPAVGSALPARASVVRARQEDGTGWRNVALAGGLVVAALVVGGVAIGGAIWQANSRGGERQTEGVAVPVLTPTPVTEAPAPEPLSATQVEINAAPPPEPLRKTQVAEAPAKSAVPRTPPHMESVAPETPVPEPPAKPAPVAPAVVEKPAPAADPTGTVRVTGDRARVRLVAETGDVAIAGDVAPGTYHILVRFPGKDEVPGVAITVRAGQTVTLDCSEAFQICRVKK